MLVLGIMTGTALDGFIDAALLETDGRAISALGPHALLPYTEALRAEMAGAVAAARAWGFAGPEPSVFATAERAFTLAHAEAIAAFLQAHGVRPDLMGVHGLTVLHRPAKPGAPGATRQLLDGALLAEKLGIPVAFDFRSADVAAGGQGAPLAPIYHAALMAFSKTAPPAAVLNLGGVANITWWDGTEAGIFAFDTGPANGPLNEWAEAHGRGAYDKDGALARAGRVHDQLLDHLLDHPFFDQPPPKSLDRYDFNAAMVRGLSPADGAATLTAFTAAAVARGFEHLPVRPKRLILCGGGRKNPALVAAIAAATGAELVDADALGWRGDAIEAEAFAFLAARAAAGLPISFPGTTGIAAPATGGRIANPQNRPSP